MRLDPVSLCEGQDLVPVEASADVFHTGVGKSHLRVAYPVRKALEQMGNLALQNAIGLQADDVEVA